MRKLAARNLTKCGKRKQVSVQRHIMSRRADCNLTQMRRKKGTKTMKETKIKLVRTMMMMRKATITSDILLCGLCLR